MSGSTYRRSALITALVGQCCVLVLWTLLVMASSGEAVASSNDCLPGWLKAPSSGTCVRFFEYPGKTWQDARAACQQHGGDLVTIRDARMNAFLTKHFRTHYYYYYIGLHDTDTETTWRWLNETETATYTNWAPHQPNNYKLHLQNYDQDCAELLDWKGWWNDFWCDLQQPYICERPPSSAAPGECEPEWFKNPSSGTCKRWYAERKSWKDATAFCRQQGGDLVTILDGQTNKFVDELRTSEKGGTCWIGLNDLSKEGEFVWPNNQKVTYKNWDVDTRKTNRNGKDCVVMGYRGTEKWSLFYCKEESSFICEKKGVCPTVDGVCPSGWSKGVSSCFKMYGLKRDWKEARTACQKDGGDLLTIRDECMTHHLEAKVKDGPYWIGLSDQKEEGRWKWLDESFMIVYKNWGPGQPSNHQTAGHKEGQDCAEIGSQKFKTQWNDADCTIAHKFICERPARPPLKVGAEVIVGIIIAVVTVCGAIIAAIIFGPRLYRSIRQKTASNANTAMSFNNPMAAS